MSNKQFTYLMIGIVVIAVVVVLMFDNGFFKGRDGVAKNDQEKQEEETVKPKNDKPPGKGFVKIGGVWRKESEIGRPVVPNTKIKEGSLRNPGQSPRVKVDVNPQVASVAHALKNRKNPERLTLFKKPDPIDKKSFEEEPKKYLNTIEPARAIMPAQPGEGVDPIKKRSPGIVRLIQGESTTLKVKVNKNSFVAFHTSDLGSFGNGIKTINVRANDEGIAEATYTATKGTVGNVRVAAASPDNSEIANFVVNVRLPDPIVKVDK